MLRDAQQVSGRREPARWGGGGGWAVAYLSRCLPYPKNNSSAPAAATNEDDLTFQREVVGPDSFVKSPDV